VLVPIPGELIATGGGFVVLRLVSLIAFVAAAVYAYRICRGLDLGPWPTGFALAYLALDQNQIFFGMAGMETQIAVAVLLAGVYYVLAENPLRAGAALGLALLARPDFVLWVVPALIYLIVRERRSGLGSLVIAALVAMPWVIFTTAYYGSPVPHTITAKNAFFSSHMPGLTDLGAWPGFLGDSLSAAQHDWMLAAPFFERFLVLDTPLPYGLLKVIAFAILALAIVGAVSTWHRASWRPAVAYATLFVLYKVFVIGPGYNEWYGPPAMAVVFILAAAGLARLTRAARPAWVVAVPATVLALAFAIHIPFTFPLERVIQHDIEDEVRDPMGRFLGSVAEPGDTIGSESAGYVSYYSNADLYDFPGLTSPAVVEALGARQRLHGIYGIAQLLEPDYLVMRPDELNLFRETEPETAAEYRILRTFSVSQAQSPLRRWGLDFFNVDREFTVLERLPAPAQAGR
jgi:hypothetical protein